MRQNIRDKGHIALYGIYFDTDSDQVEAESAGALGEIATLLTGDAGLELYVVGHTDSVGEADYNQALSERRARAVVRSLVDSHEIDRSRLVAMGAGLMAPIATNDTEEGRALNRRVVLVKQ
jgi:outer membrane protein OmpA-like peptidoglycan-associated protein